MAVGWRGTFSSFRYRDYRLFWFAQSVTSGGYWMDQISRGWLVLLLTNSPFVLGLTFGLRAVPILIFSPMAGVAADRLPRKPLLMAAQGLSVALHLSLAFLIISGWIEVWHVLLNAALDGFVHSFQQPIRQAIMPSLVPRDRLANAIGLSSAGLGITRSLGPAAAGLVIAASGTGFAYLVQGALYFVAFTLTGFMHIARLDSPRVDSPLESFVEGIRFMRRHEVVGSVLLITLVPIILVQPFVSLLSVFARDVLEIGPAGLGLLLAASGMGSIVGTISVAMFGSSILNKGRVLQVGAIGFGLGIGLFAFSTSVPISVVLLGFAGISQMLFYSMAQTLLHANISDDVRGRVMGVFFVEQGLVPLGTFSAGSLAAAVGAPLAVGGMALLATVLLAGIVIMVPRIRRIR